VAAYFAALDGAPDDLDAWMGLGVATALLGHASLARFALGRAIELGAGLPSGGRARMLRDRGVALLAIGEVEEGLASLTDATRAAPDDRALALVLAESLHDHGAIDPAVALAQDCVDRAPTLPEAHFVLARTVYERDPERALDHARRALDLAPRFFAARLLLAGALALERREDAARAAIHHPDVDLRFVALVARLADLARDAPVARFTSRASTLAHALALAPQRGPVLEFGVRHGVSTRLLASTLATSGAGASLHAFDSFAGLPEAWQGRAPGAFSTRHELPSLPPNVIVHPGWFETTLPVYLTTEPDPPRLVHVDSDLYSSACTVLRALGPRLRATDDDGPIVLFDECFANATWRDDEHRALVEVSRELGLEPRFLSVNWLTGQAAVRLCSTGGRALPLR
jgi:tetratricopeptide (TPR) repeat protein